MEAQYIHFLSIHTSLLITVLYSILHFAIFMSTKMFTITIPDTKRTSKRILKLQRGSERDLKLDIASAQAIGALSQNINEQPTTPIPSYQIEGKNQYLSLSCRTVQCQRSQSVKHPRSILGVLKQQQNEEPGDTGQDEECPNSRKEFYDTLSLLIRLGSNSERNPRRGVSVDLNEE